MTITRRADQELDGTAPALLYGYGGFKISLSARFSPSWMTWVKTFGGVLVRCLPGRRSVSWGSD
jgi:prolyl oligopeptidase